MSRGLLNTHAAAADDTDLVAHPWIVALVQAPPATSSDPIAQLAAEIAALCADRPDLSMVVYPEIHLFGGSDLAADANAWLAEAAEPLDGPPGHERWPRSRRRTGSG